MRADQPRRRVLDAVRREHREQWQRDVEIVRQFEMRERKRREHGNGTDQCDVLVLIAPRRVDQIAVTAEDPKDQEEGPGQCEPRQFVQEEESG